MIRVLAELWTFVWLLLISREDLRSFTIPNKYILAILAAAPFLSAASLSSRILAALLPAILIPFMGMGDVKLYSALGFGVGIWPLLQIVCLSSLAGGVVAGLLLLLHRLQAKDRLAFGPFIACAAVPVLLVLSDRGAIPSAVF